MMTEKEFFDMLDTTEPCFSFRGVDYQICALNGRYLAGLADNEEEDRWFNTKEELSQRWLLQGVPLCDAFPELDFG